LLAVLWLAGLFSLSGFIVPAAAQLPFLPEEPERVANVLVFTTAINTPIVTAFGADTESMNTTVITSAMLASMSLDAFNSTLNSSDVIFVDRFLPENLTYLHMLVSYVNGTMGYEGLVMFGIMQNGSIPGDGDLSPSQVSAIEPILPVNLSVGYVNSTANSSAPGFAIQVEPAAIVPENATIIVDYFPWDACPLIDRRLVVAAKPAASLVLTDQTDNETVLAEWSLGGNGSQVMAFSMEINEHNLLLRSSPYFGYLMYLCAFHSMNDYSDSLIDTWGEWTFPGGLFGDSLWVWIILVIVLIGIAFWLYLKTRKKGNKAADRKAVAASEAGKDRKICRNPSGCLSLDRAF
jgi:cbb3-type cytochrome oxidase subunit 3